MMKYFKCVCKAGHFGGRKKQIHRVVYICANSMIEAMICCQNKPGIAHNKTPNIREITEEEYLVGKEENATSFLEEHIKAHLKHPEIGYLADVVRPQY